jgi:hypothetical protein
MYDQFDVTLEDVDLLGEVELTTNLIIAASEADGPLSTDEIDRILGVTPQVAADDPAIEGAGDDAGEVDDRDDEGSA